jgi:hypothetical protein
MNCFSSKIEQKPICSFCFHNADYEFVEINFLGNIIFGKLCKEHYIAYSRVRNPKLYEKICSVSSK